MCLNAVNLMCRERLAFGGTHPPGLSGVRATEYKFPFRGSCLRTQVSLSWRDELQRHGPRGIAGDCVAERKFRRGDLCSGARRASNEAGYFNEQILLSLPSVRSPHLALQWKGIFLRGVTYRLNHEWCHRGWRYHHGRHKLTTRLPIVSVSELASATRMTM